MLLSMTGFGRGSASSGTKKFTVELKSLNSKQFDLMMRVPQQFRAMEVPMRNALLPLLQRGKVDLTVSIETLGAEVEASINLAVVSAYKAQIEEMSRTLQIPLPEDWYATLLRLPDALSQERAEADEKESAALMEAVTKAAGALTEFRQTEGAKLELFFQGKIEEIRQKLALVDPFEEERVPKIKAKLYDQLSRLEGVEFDTGRLEQELIFYLEKLDVTEEKTRLRAHLNYFLDTMAGEPGQGKKLGFIAQEIGREINTLGSKSNNADMQRIVVGMKDDLEQIKEQVLNVL